MIRLLLSTAAGGVGDYVGMTWSPKWRGSFRRHRPGGSRQGADIPLQAQTQAAEAAEPAEASPRQALLHLAAGSKWCSDAYYSGSRTKGCRSTRSAGSSPSRIPTQS